MVASTATNDPSVYDATAPAVGPGGRRLRRARGGLRRMLASVVRVADLQYRIWLTQAKLTLQRMLIYAALFAAATVLGILAIIFLYIGVFHLLTDVAGLRPVWAYLIYGGFHLVLAVVLVMVGTSMLGKKDPEKAEAKENATEHAREPADEPQKAT